jgi:ABC-2 type transport system permease protein
MWRFRNLLQIFIVFFLWDTIFSGPEKSLFGYDKAKILTYILGLVLVRAFVLSARAMDVAGEISRGDINNYLVKPINYFRYWMVRDFSSKALNLVFAFLEILVLYILLRPPFFVQENLLLVLASLISVVLAMFIYFVILFISSSVPFWIPEAAWGVHFLVSTIIIEFLSGALFPLDVLPQNLQLILSYTPFPYLIFFPIQVYLGKVVGVALLKGILISFSWYLCLLLLMDYIWKRGLKAYQAYGR